MKRRRARREPKRQFTLFCEGKKTEPAYFDAIKRSYSSALVGVEIVPGVGVPHTIAQKAVEFAKTRGLTPRSRHKKESFEEGDQVWAVFDRDEHPLFDEAVRFCEQHGIGVGRSDPCFELWLILHEVDHDRSDGSHAMQRKLRALRPEYDPNSAKTPDCADLVTRIAEAEQRGEALLQRREDEDDPYGNPSTTVGRLTRAVRDASESAQP